MDVLLYIQYNDHILEQQAKADKRRSLYIDFKKKKKKKLTQLVGYLFASQKLE